MAKFAQALDTIRNAVVDFSKLEVRTFVGTIDVTVDGSGDPDWDALMKSAITSGDIKLAASTTLRIDGDSDNFEDTDRMTDGLRDAHKNAVAAGQEARNAIFKLISGRIGQLIEN
jgi:hypothetical protein